MQDPYVRLRGRELYRNPWLAVEAHEIVHPNGAPGEHLLVVIPQACAVVVEDGDDLLFTRQPRFAARRWVVEVVKGGADAGETPLECARRELREELGASARRWTALGHLYEIPSIVNEPLNVFLASEITLETPDPEVQESIDLVRIAARDAIAAAAAGEIDDAVTVAALFRYATATGRLRTAPEA